MATIALCPRCRQSITLPIESIPDQHFLCPLCSADFSVQEALSPNEVRTAPSAMEPAGPAAGSNDQLRVEFVSEVRALRDAPTSAQLRRPERHCNWLGQLFGVVGGGLIGLVAGYAILLRLRGAEADFLGIRDHVPAWVTGIPTAPPTDAFPEAPVDRESSPGATKEVQP